MLPILLIHGYASEGSKNTVEEIYGSLPDDLRTSFGDTMVVELNLSRWISLNDGISIDDVSYAMERALRKHYPDLLITGFNVVIHSTGALVVRNWIKLFSTKPCPIQNFVHLAGANFGSGLAHIGRGQLMRWGRRFAGTGRGMKVLNELEFGAWKTIDLHRHFLARENDMYDAYEVQEFCLIGSQTPKSLRHVPIRYLKEDSSDNTVRTSAGNLNYNYLAVTPKSEAYEYSLAQLKALIEQRYEDDDLTVDTYSIDYAGVASKRRNVPYFIAFETAHFGDDIGIVGGSKNRKNVVPLIHRALAAEADSQAYSEIADAFEVARLETFKSAQALKWSKTEWNKQKQYEGHAQVIFRLKDQFGGEVEDFDITLRSAKKTKKHKLESMIEDKHVNRKNEGTITFYLRTQHYDKQGKAWVELLDNVAPLTIEVTANEGDSDDIDFVPLRIKLTSAKLRIAIQSFRTTIVDITMLRLPRPKVFAVK